MIYLTVLSFRKRLNLTQKSLAIQIIKKTGVDPYYDLMEIYNYMQKIGRWERDDTSPNARDFILLSKALDISLEELASHYI